MSFSFNAAGTPKECIAEVGKQAASQPAVPNQFADAINSQLSRLPEDAEVTLVAFGDTGWHEGQNVGQLAMHATLDVRSSRPPVERIVDKDPEVQPGPERFPDDFTGDEAPGPSASDVAET